CRWGTSFSGISINHRGGGRRIGIFFTGTQKEIPLISWWSPRAASPFSGEQRHGITNREPCYNGVRGQLLEAEFAGTRFVTGHSVLLGGRMMGLRHLDRGPFRRSAPHDLKWCRSTTSDYMH